MRIIIFLIFIFLNLTCKSSVRVDVDTLRCPIKDGKIQKRLPTHIFSLSEPKKGVYIKANINKDVFAVTNGTVVKIGNLYKEINSIIIQEGDYTFLYHNLSEISVQIGENIEPCSKKAKFTTHILQKQKQEMCLK